MKSIATLIFTAATFLTQFSQAEVISKPGKVGIIFVGVADRATVDSNFLVSSEIESIQLNGRQGKGSLNLFGTTTFLRPGTVVKLTQGAWLYSKAGYIKSEVAGSAGEEVRILSYEISRITGSVAAVVEVIK